MYMYGHLTEACRKEFAGAIQTETRGNSSKQAQDGDARTEFDRRLKTVKGRVGKYVVNTLRDSGCTTICMDRKFIDDDQLTGGYKKCKLIDGTERKLMTAMADVDTPYVTKRQVTVVCMDNPISDLVIGNVDGAACKCRPKSDMDAWRLHHTCSHYTGTRKSREESCKPPECERRRENRNRCNTSNAEATNQ